MNTEAMIAFKSGGEWLYCPLSGEQLASALAMVASDRKPPKLLSVNGVLCEQWEGNLELMPGFRMKYIIPVAQPRPMDTES